jgi:hypothetical protein
VSADRSRLDRKDPPESGNAAQLVFSSIEEDVVGADDQIAHRAADEHLAGARKGADAGTDMSSKPPDVAGREQLALAGVQAGANIQPKLAQALANGDRAADRSAWAIERGEHPISERLDELPSVALDLLASECVVAFE